METKFLVVGNNKEELNKLCNELVLEGYVINSLISNNFICIDMKNKYIDLFDVDASRYISLIDFKSILNVYRQKLLDKLDEVIPDMLWNYKGIDIKFFNNRYNFTIDGITFGFKFIEAVIAYIENL